MINTFSKNLSKDAIIWKNKVYNYDFLIKKYYHWINNLSENEVAEGSVVVIESDFSPNSISLFLALIKINCIIVPLTDSVSSKREKFIEISQAGVIIQIDRNDKVLISKKSKIKKNGYYQELNYRKNPGLVLFSSGTTGESKAAVHDLKFILKKFTTPKRTFRSIAFLLYDHIGGVNTMLYILSNAGCLITVNDRSPNSVLKTIQKYKVELLPTSPTFINLVLMSEAYKEYNLDSLKVITYGTESMPQNTLTMLNKILPEVKLQQTYGLSEVGILRSKSKNSKSLWVKIGGEGFETRVVNNLLEIKAKSAMMGYLNAPSPFTSDGWFKTGDEVEVDGDYFKFKGRKSDIINVGGEKVYPQEIENVILKVEGILDVTVFGSKNPIVGNIVCARVVLKNNNDEQVMKKEIKRFCRKQLETFKVPVKISFSKSNQYSSRFKKIDYIRFNYFFIKC